MVGCKQGVFPYLRLFLHPVPGEPRLLGKLYVRMPRDPSERLCPDLLAYPSHARLLNHGSCHPCHHENEAILSE